MTSSTKSAIYFASDFHLGAAGDLDHKREQKIVRWLNQVKHDMAELYLLGDVFDFWFEYKYVVPKGHVRLLGKLAELSDSGVKLHIFTGNHDVWMFDYLERELNAKVYKEPVDVNFFGKEYQIGHGDGLGPGDSGFKAIKRLFTNRLAQRCFAFLHPWIGVSLARFFSRKSRENTGDKDSIYLGDDKEYLMQHCKEYLLKKHIDCFVFGHRHMVLDKIIEPNSRYVNLGEWFSSCYYAKIEPNSSLELIQFND